LDLFFGGNNSPAMFVAMAPQAWANACCQQRTGQKQTLMASGNSQQRTLSNAQAGTVLEKLDAKDCCYEGAPSI